ncbi:MAG: inorganic phosphate transporter, partial [Deltaproteobacteria bacterium]|nr:inorganic phosphate transporter [Deltaproteobacteria bacterium]
PLLGGLASYLLMVLVVLFFHDKHPGPLDKWFRRLQLASSAAFSLGHGSNDAQKTAGIIFALLLATGYLPKEATVPFWVLLLSYTTIGLGTMAGGWKVIQTLGQRLTKLKPVGGFCAETGAAITLFGTALAGIPVSTTHTITGSIVGVGAIQRLSAIRWGIAGKVVWAWVLTIPLSAALAGFMYSLLKLFGIQ